MGIMSLLSSTSATSPLPHRHWGAREPQPLGHWGAREPGSHSPSAYTEDAINPGLFPPFPFSLATSPGRSVQPRRKPSRTHIPLPHSPPAQVAQKSLPAGDVGMGQLLPHPIKLPLHHLESREETTRAAPLSCTCSAPLGDAWHRMPADPWLPRAALPLAFP